MSANFALTIAFRVYLFDEDAYNCYNNFFKKLENHFVLYENAEVKIEDIKYVIADFLDSKLKDETRNLRLIEIENLLSFLGSESNWDNHYKNKPDIKSVVQSKKFSRIIEGSFLAGIFSGCSDYFGVHVLFFRVIFVLLCIPFQAFIAVYVILWIFLPISEKKHAYILDQNKVTSKIAKWSSNVFGKISGLIIIILSIVSFCAVFFILFLYFERLNYWYQIFGLGKNNEKLLWVSTVLILFIPCVLFFLFGTRLILGRPYNIKIWRFNFLLWGASIAGVLFVSFQIIVNLNSTKYSTVSEQFLIQKKLIIITDYPKENTDTDFQNLRINFFITEKDSFCIIKKISASGRNIEEAKKALENIKYKVSFNNDTVRVKCDFIIKDKNLFRAQEVNVDFYIPINTSISLTNFNKRYINFSTSVLKSDKMFIDKLPTFQSQLILTAENRGFRISQ